MYFLYLIPSRSLSFPSVVITLVSLTLRLRSVSRSDTHKVYDHNMRCLFDLHIICQTHIIYHTPSTLGIQYDFDLSQHLITQRSEPKCYARVQL